MLDNVRLLILMLGGELVCKDQLSSRGI